MSATAIWKEALIAAMFIGTMMAPVCLAQSQLLDPQGRQVKAPSDMPKQPSLESEVTKPKNVDNTADGDKTAPVFPRTGGLVVPETIASNLRIGPVYAIPMWQRTLLAVWMMLQLVVLIVIAVTMQIVRSRVEKQQHGHIINPETTEAFNLHRNP